MSGTSCDGVDGALVAFDGDRVELLDFVFFSYEAAFQERLLAKVKEARELCLLHAQLGERFCEAALELIRRGKERGVSADFVASHGHTVAHYPPDGTLQIGDAARIAEGTGLTVVADFRARDMAAGGQGAPLVPYADWVLFRQDKESLGCLNIGGIANVSVVTPDFDGVFAFDTGPGNMIIDSTVRHLTAGARTLDQDGRAAAQGRVVPGLLAALLEHPYLAKVPPKSTGRETFGFEPYLKYALSDYQKSSFEDIIATVSKVVALTIADAIRNHVLPERKLARLIVSGGGAFNPTLLDWIQEALHEVPLVRSEEHGIRSDAREALAFAILGQATLSGRPANVPRATGASHPVILGGITPPGPPLIGPSFFR